MADKAPWFKFFPRDWLTGTQALSFELKGIYWEVCTLIYDAQAPIRNDAGLVARRDPACTERRCRRLLDELIGLGKLKVTDDGRLTNGKSLDVIVDTELRLESARDAGRASAARARRLRLQAKNRGDTRQPRQRPGQQSESEKNQRESSHREISTVAAREAGPVPVAQPAHDDVPDPVTQVARAFTQHRPPDSHSGPGLDRPPDRAEIDALVASLGVDPTTVEVPPPPVRAAGPVERPPSTAEQLADLATAERRRFMGGA
jgi:hypothetical protein